MQRLGAGATPHFERDTSLIHLLPPFIIVTDEMMTKCENSIDAYKVGVHDRSVAKVKLQRDKQLRVTSFRLNKRD